MSRARQRRRVVAAARYRNRACRLRAYSVTKTMALAMTGRYSLTYFHVRNRG